MEWFTKGSWNKNWWKNNKTEQVL